jgi:hypothetical protein
MKTLIAIIVLVVIAIAAALYGTTLNESTNQTSENSPGNLTEEGIGNRIDPRNSGEVNNPINIDISKLKVATFAGKLEEVNTGCFADGECYVVVGGKKVTVLMGWSREIVGTIIGAGSIGDLEYFLDEQVEVYAQELSSGDFTLYDNDSFYIKVLNGGSVNVEFRQSTTVSGLSIKFISILEDSRCPIDVNCIQAGTVRVQTELVSEDVSYEQAFTLGQAVLVTGKEITLVQVEPYIQSDVATTDSSYRLTFKVINK